MEVHHHSHTPRKKWTHYFWEFLMLFLAVFCGFLAEYQLEHVIEHKKEKQFISGLIRDLATDTVVVQEVIAQDQDWIKKLDTALSFPRTKLNQLPVQDSFVYYVEQGAWFLGSFNPTDKTLNQLKHTGSFRLIRNSSIIDSLSEYESILKDLDAQKAYYIAMIFEFKSSYNAVVDRTQMPAFRQAMKETGKIPDDMQMFISSEKAKIDVLYNNIYNQKLGMNLYCVMMQNHLEFIKRLIVSLKEEYHLK